ncbi:MAG: hypothetical protein ACI9IP_001061 [Arcticibacterium sp.]|jgi:hypothetical protein
MNYLPLKLVSLSIQYKKVLFYGYGLIKVDALIRSRVVFVVLPIKIYRVFLHCAPLAFLRVISFPRYSSHRYLVNKECKRNESFEILALKQRKRPPLARWPSVVMDGPDNYRENRFNYNAFNFSIISGYCFKFVMYLVDFIDFIFFSTFNASFLPLQFMSKYNSQSLALFV